MILISNPGFPEVGFDLFDVRLVRSHKVDSIKVSERLPGNREMLKKECLS